MKILLTKIGKKSKKAFSYQIDSKKKNKVLKDYYKLINKSRKIIISENKKDIENAERKRIRDNLKERLIRIDDWDEVNIDDVLLAYREEKQLSVPKVNQPLRIALTGSTNSPSLGMTLSLFEKKEAILRIEKLIDLI